MNNLQDVLNICVNCTEKGLRKCDDCPVCSQGLVTDCIPATVPTDEELALLAGAGQEAIKRLTEKHLDEKPIISGPAPGIQNPLVTDRDFKMLSRKSEEIYINQPDIFRGANGQIVNQPKLTPEQLDAFRKESWWDDYCE